MARERWTSRQWDEEAYRAILDLVRDRKVVPWPEVEARITHSGWKDFRKVQPLQLSGARRRFRAERPLQVIEESTGHDPPITTLRIPFPPGGKRELERLRGQRRKKYRRYLAIAADHRLCGHHAEQVVLASLQEASTPAGLWVPPQEVGRIRQISDVPIVPGPLDALALLLDLGQDPIAVEVPVAVEVKNLHKWIYPWTQELWELLVKAAAVATQTPVLPLLACPFNSWSTFLLAQDVGFLTCPYGAQLFSPHIDADEFAELIDEFALPMVRHAGPYEPIVSWLKKMLRVSPPPSPPEEDILFYRRQAQRFEYLATAILDFSALSGGLPDDTRRETYDAFKHRLAAVSDWELTGGY
jgi:hypothetical protein